MDEELESKEGFKVTDKRRFTTEGGTKDTAETQEKPEAKEPPQEETPDARTETKSKASPPPPMDFSMFVLSMANTALFQLGFIKDPEAGEPKKDLQGARQTIDLIAILEEKTRGNLNDQEAKIIKEALFQLRMAFVEASK
jgi:hypothetical protein